MLEHHAFRDGDITTHFIDTYLKDKLEKQEKIPIEALIALSVYDTLHIGPLKKESRTISTVDKYSPWKLSGKWRIGD